MSLQVVIPMPGAPLLVLDRVELDQVPEYCLHGSTRCTACAQWCWLGRDSHDMIASGQARPVCTQCANRIAPPEALIGHVNDWRRADGPHAERDGQ